MLNILDADEAGIIHGIGKPVAAGSVRRCADMVGAVLAQVLPADVLIACPALGTVKPAAFVAQEFDFLPERQRQGVQLRKRVIQPEIRNHIPEFAALKLFFKRVKPCQHFGGGGDKVEAGIPLSEIGEQKVRGDDDAALRRAAVLKQGTDGVAGSVGKMFFS